MEIKKQKLGLRTPPPRCVVHNSYIFVSVNDGDHDSVVRIFIGLSYELHYIKLFGTVFFLPGV